jgi:hypothetical protein
MEMDTGNWLTILGAILSAGVTYGIVATKLAGIVADIRELKRSREDQGKRLGELKVDITKLQERIKLRRNTQGGVGPPPDIVR